MNRIVGATMPNHALFAASTAASTGGFVESALVAANIDRSRLRDPLKRLTELLNDDSFAGYALDAPSFYPAGSTVAAVVRNGNLPSHPRLIGREPAASA